MFDIGTGITIFGVAFGAWAWVVAWGVSVIRKEVESLKAEIVAVNSTQVMHVNQTERRLTMLETEFTFFKTVLMNKLNAQHSNNGSNED